MSQSPIIRKVRADELPSLLSLYRHLHPADPELTIDGAIEALWQWLGPIYWPLEQIDRRIRPASCYTQVTPIPLQGTP